MDPVRNPFFPGAGHPPPLLVGREPILSEIDVATQRVALGRYAKSFVLNGLRGVGKTILLLHVQNMAIGHGFRTEWAEASDGDTLHDTIVPGVKRLLAGLSISVKAKAFAKSGLDMIKRALSGVKIEAGGVALQVETPSGTGDEADPLHLEALLVLLGDAAKAAGQPVALFLDEVQFLSQQDFGILARAMHRIAQRQLPLIIFAAGLPDVMGLAGESYAERLFRYYPIGPLTEAEAAEAIRGPIVAEGAGIAHDALDLIIERTQCYPYFLQQWGHDSWNAASGDEITRADVERASGIATEALDDGFFRARYERCSASEQRYMRALAELGPGAHGSGEVARLLRLTTPGAAPTRQKLLRKGMIYTPGHGLAAFTVPLFDDYMRRTMPFQKP